MVLRFVSIVFNLPRKKNEIKILSYTFFSLLHSSKIRFYWFRFSLSCATARSVDLPGRACYVTLEGRKWKADIRQGNWFVIKIYIHKNVNRIYLDRYTSSHSDRLQIVLQYLKMLCLKLAFFCWFPIFKLFTQAVSAEGLGERAGLNPPTFLQR